jgi:hypothetical protein
MEAHIRDVSPAAAAESVAAGTPLVPGLPLINIPKYTVNAALNYSHPFTADIRATARLSTTTIGPYHDLSYYFEELPGYTVTDLRLGIVRGPLQAFLFANNMANKRAVTTINTQAWSLPIPSLTRAVITTPRTIGIDFNYNF